MNERYEIHDPMFDINTIGLRSNVRREDLAYLRNAQWKIKLLKVLPRVLGSQRAIDKIQRRVAEIIAARLLRRWPYDAEWF